MVAVAAVVVIAPANAVTTGQAAEKVPIIGVMSVELGNSAFSSTESFHIHPGTPTVQRTSHVLNLSFSGKIVSPINDSLIFNDSIHLTTNSLTVDYPVHNGTYRLSIPSQRAYLNSISIQGNTSYAYLTIEEDIPTQEIFLNGLQASSTQLVQNNDIYNLTLLYGNSSFVLHSPGLLNVGGVLSQVSLSINSAVKGGSSYLSFSFPIKDGSFSFVFNQVLSSGQPIANDVMSYFQISGFSSPLVQHLTSNSVSVGIGAAIFLVVVVGLFVYYRKK
jgi:hypothetical protein